MKKLTATLLASSLLGLAAYAQGTVNFVNVNSGAGLNAPIFLNDGTTKVGAGFTAELLAGPSASSLASVATTGFLTGAGAGYFQGGTVTIPGVAGGATAFLEVRVYSTASGSYAAASAAGALNTFGHSGVFSVATGNPGASPPTTPAALVGLTSFNLNPAIPEPSSLALAGLGAAALLAFRRRK